MTTAVPACSFCGKTRKEVRVLVEGRAGFICDGCVRKAQSPDAHVATCASCTPREGKHATTCEADDLESA